MKRVAVIGAGVGGLAASLRLAHAGMRVTLFERNASLGGKLGWLECDGYSWDTGPSLLTMPHVFEELFAAVGRRLQDYVDLIRLESTCRYHWTDGTVIDENAEFWRRPDVEQFLRYARGLYDLSSDAFLNHPLEDWWRQLTPGFLPRLRHLPKIASMRSMAEKVRTFFPKDFHLQQLFNRFATYNGSSPYLTPAAFNIIPYVQAKFGGWYVRGGLHSLAQALGKAAVEMGVEIRTACEVHRSESLDNGVSGWTLVSDAGEEKFDVVVCNQDVLTATRRFLPRDLNEQFRRTHLGVLPLSTSGFILYLGVRGQHSRLAHHNIFFSNDYPREFAQMHEEKRPADDPTIYVCIHSKSDPARAPAGCENWFVLVNAPAVDDRVGPDWGNLRESYAEHLLNLLETRCGFPGLRQQIAVREVFTPADLETRFLAHRGALYGFASHGVMSAFRRPRLEPQGVSNFYFVGGSTHPGGGLPLVALSGKMIAERILRRANPGDASPR